MANPTGFDMKEFKAAAHPRSKWAQSDPWRRGELWRYTGHFSRFNRYKKMFPGLGTASVLFAGYCVYEAMFLKEEHGHHGAHHETGTESGIGNAAGVAVN